MLCNHKWLWGQVILQNFHSLSKSFVFCFNSVCKAVLQDIVLVTTTLSKTVIFYIILRSQNNVKIFQYRQQNPSLNCQINYLVQNNSTLLFSHPLQRIKLFLAQVLQAAGLASPTWASTLCFIVFCRMILFLLLARL